MLTFDADILRALRDLKEVGSGPAPQERGGDLDRGGRRRGLRAVVPRYEGPLVRGSRGRRAGHLEFAGRRLAVKAIPANEPAAIDKASREYLRKYQSSPHAQAMVQPDVLPTTLRLSQ